jgi:hypothetical protein
MNALAAIHVPVMKTLFGWKDIANYLSAAWGRDVRWYSAARYWRATDDPLPAEIIRRRAQVTEEALRLWAYRQRIFRRRP